jgi:hypothetical protein
MTEYDRVCVTQAAASVRVYLTLRLLCYASIVMASACNCDCTLLRTNNVDFLNDGKLAWCSVKVLQARSRQICISSTNRGQSILFPTLPLSHSRRRIQGPDFARRKQWCKLTSEIESVAGIIYMRHDTRQIAISSGKGSPVLYSSHLRAC